MAGEPNQALWRGVRPTDPEEPFTVIQGTAANLKVQAAIAAGQSITVVQPTAANLKVEAAIAAGQDISIYPKKPPTAVQVSVSGTVTDDEEDVYTVAADKTLYLHNIMCMVRNNFTTIKYGRVTTTLSGGAIVDTLFHILTWPGTTVFMPLALMLPLEVPATNIVKVRSQHADLLIRYWIHGYVI